MKRPARAILLLAVLGGLFASMPSQAQIVGSKHDFSSATWSGGEICKPCHAPHFSDTSRPEPLWNHQLSSQTYLLYQSPTLKEQIDQPGPKSVICLSCHDGTVALDSFGGNPGSETISGDGFLDIDLKDDHPIGVFWSHQYPDLNCSNCHNQYDDTWERPLPFFDDKVECLTCHEPHNAEGTAVGMLRVTAANSELCQHCHAK